MEEPLYCLVLVGYIDVLLPRVQVYGHGRVAPGAGPARARLQAALSQSFLPQELGSAPGRVPDFSCLTCKMGVIMAPSYGEALWESLYALQGNCEINAKCLACWRHLKHISQKRGTWPSAGLFLM